MAESVLSFRRRTALTLAAAGVAALAACGGGDLLLPDDAGAAALAVVDGNGQTGTVGDPLATPLAVGVTDAQGRPVVGARVVFIPPDGLPGASVSPDVATTGSDGRAATTYVLGTIAGEQTVRARLLDAATDEPPEVSFTVSATAAAAARLIEVRGDEQSARVGSALADSLVVRVEDRFGNPVAGVEVRWEAAGGGSVSPPVDTTGANGLAATLRTLGSTAGSQAASASVEGLEGSPVAFSAVATPSAVSTERSSVAVSTGTLEAGAGSAEVVVTARDAFDNPVPGAVVVLAASGGGNSLAQPGVTDASGVARGSFSATRAGQHEITATIDGQPVSPPARVQVTPSAPDPGQTTAEVPNGTFFQFVPFTVTTRDRFGNRVTTGGQTVTVFLIFAGGRSPVPVNDNGDGTYSGRYFAFGIGVFELEIRLNDVEIQGSPYPSVVGTG